MPLRYLFKTLLLPPGVLLLLLVLGWWLRGSRPRLALLCWVTGLGGLWLMSLPVAVEQAARQLERVPPLALEQWSTLADQADAIVVLGNGRERNAPAWGEDVPTDMGLQRLQMAARLAKASGLPLLVSGGLHYGQPPSEARIMSDVLSRDFGVSVRWLEERSRTTWENATMTAQQLAPSGLTRVVLVTQAWHMPRARWSFEQAGFTVIGAPVGFLGVDNARPFGGWLPESRAFGQSALLLNEAAGALVYPWVYP
ncbi:YdcF family protein [Pseudomonas sp. 21LCFQ02]|uniref:YdcF family protein n=1 Tax=unclassified Pseudomonas TaxID=196821 RepID=UPI00209AAE48|nr:MULTISPECIES: YdcF family protein [unclassified Pseudomonas]MCO8170799.1 YdcF family protein [Pseudomonas sp. 21LCFQ02]MCQ9424601.1 YdcF family protein [Pseudomonas sp. LJDD11]